MKGITEKLTQLDALLVDIAVHLDKDFYPRFLTVVASCRLPLERGMKLFLTKCLNSLDYRTMLGKLLSCAIRRGMQKGLDASIEHGKEGRKLADIAANNPNAKADYNSAYQTFCELDFPLLLDLSSCKDSNIEDVMHLLQLEAEVAEKLGLADLQPSLEQLFVPRIRDNLVVGEASLSSSLNIIRQRVKKIRENISIGQPVLAVVFTSVARPLSSEVLLGSGSTFSSEPITTIVNPLSASSAPALSIGSLSMDHIPVSDVNKDGDVITFLPFSDSHEGKLDIALEHSHA